jgi:hypothetical protein
VVKTVPDTLLRLSAKMAASDSGYSLRTVVLAAGACSFATTAVALVIARSWSQSLTQELNELQRRWTTLQHTVSALPIEDSGFALSMGTHVCVREYGEVSNSSLWDASNTKFCDRVGTIIGVDDDGDATVRLDSGEEIVCDVKFLVAAVTSDLKANMAGMQKAMRELSHAVGRKPPPVIFDG